MRTETRTQTAFRAIVAIAGVGLLVTLIVGAANEWASAALLLLLVGALLCFLLALESHRFSGLKGAGIVAELTQDLDHEVQETLFSNVAATYAFVHNSLAGDEEAKRVKIQLQDALIQLAQDTAFSHRLEREQVEETITQGTPAERAIAFGVLTSNSDWSTVALLLEGIKHSRSGNEQYHALLAAEAKWASLNEVEKAQLSAAIKDSEFISDDSDRREVAERLGVVFDK